MGRAVQECFVSFERDLEIGLSGISTDEKTALGPYRTPDTVAFLSIPRKIARLTQIRQVSLDFVQTGVEDRCLDHKAATG